MSPSQLLLIAAAVCFVLEALELRGPKWWAVGIACWLAANV